MFGIYPGSFDPVTNGHMDIIGRAAGICENLIVLVSYNPVKNADFSPEERLGLLKKSVASAGYSNVECDMWGGLLVDYFREKNADVIFKGLRALSDFEHEFQMAHVNKELCKKAETIFLCSDVNNTFLSSNVVKQIASFGGDFSQFVPDVIFEEIKERLCCCHDVKPAGD